MDLRFVGRIREQETLRRLLVDYVVVTLHGAAGVGKSALVQSFVDAETQAGRLAPARLVSLRGLDHPRAIVAATRRALGLDDQVRGRSAAELLASLFDAPPHTIVWDDAPPIVNELVRAWATRAPAPRWRLIVVTRAPVAAAGDAGIATLELPPLARADALALVAQLEIARGATLHEDLLRRTGGNPLLLQLALMVRDDGGPVEVTATFAELVENSSRAARQALILLRAAGTPIDLRALRATLELPDAATVEELRRRLLLRVDGERIALTSHADDAAALLEPPSAATWSTLSAVAARMLATDPLDGDALVAACRARAALGDGGGALALLDAHGGARAALGRQRRLTQLLGELTAIDPEHNLELRLLLTREQLRLGDIHAATHTLDAADRLPAPPELSRRRNLLRLEVLIRLGEPHEAALELGRARDVPALSEDHAAIAAAVMLALAGELGQSRSMLRALAPLTRQCPVLEASRAAGLTMVYLCEERYDRAVVCARRARRSYAAVDAPFFEAFVVLGEAMALLESDRIDRAAALAVPAGDHALDGAATLEPLGHDLGAAVRAGVLGRRGDLRGSLAILEPLFHALDRRADRVARDVVARYLARACIGLARFDEAEAYLRQAAGLGAVPGLDALLPLVDREWASLAASRGDHEEAARRVRGAVARAPGNPLAAIDLWALDESDSAPPAVAVATAALGAYTALRSAEKSLGRGAFAEAEAAAGIAARWYSASGIELEHVHALLLGAEASLRGGNVAAGRGAVAAAEARASARGYRLLALRAMLLEAAFADRSGDLDGYVAALRRAVTLAEDDLCDRSLHDSCRRAGLPPPPIGNSVRATAALVERLGLARPARYLVSVRDRVYVVDDDEWPTDGNLLVDFESGGVGRDGEWDPWPEMRLRILERLVEAGEEGLSAEALYLDVWGGREYHPLRHRNMVYVAVRRLRRALRRWVGPDTIELTDDARYRLVPSLQPAVRRPLPGLHEHERRRSRAVARWDRALQRATDADVPSGGGGHLVGQYVLHAPPAASYERCWTPTQSVTLRKM